MKPRLTSTFRYIHNLVACWTAVLLFQAPAVLAIDVVADTATGEVFLFNSSIGSQSVDGYQIDSPLGSLLPSNLGGVTGVSDLSGDMSFDSVADWFVITSTTNSVVEASLVESSGNLGPGETVSLGILWDNNGSQDLTAIVTSGLTVFNNPVQYLDLTGDYDENITVDLLDYLEFFLSFGSTVDLDADGNGDGIVNSADYTIWRDAYELAIAPTLAQDLVSEPVISSVSLATAVPEPSAVCLMLMALMSLTVKQNRNNRD